MRNEIEKFLIQHKLAVKENTLLVGFSGGCDSLCLLDNLNCLRPKYGFNLVAIHLNHNWRGEESKRDEVNCQNFCEKNDIEFVSECLNGDEPKTETFARDARYDFFVRTAKKYQNSSIFTAHTRTDNAETLVYRIIKGTGINGLRGILPASMREGVALYRPLLKISREETEAYCISKGLIANQDSSNENTKYNRNFIRHNIMPKFKELNYNYEKSIVSLAQTAIDESKIAEEYLEIVKKVIYDDKKIITANFKKLSKEIMQKIIYDVCLREGWDYDYKKVLNILDFIKENFDSKAGSKYSVAKDLWIFANSDYIMLVGNRTQSYQYLELSIPTCGEYKIPNSDYILSIKEFGKEIPASFPKADAFKAFIKLENFENLVLRHRFNGDVISPFGMSGKMKLKKYLNSKGVLKEERDELLLLCNEKEVLWVVGVGLSNTLKVEDIPTHVVELVHGN